MDGGVPGEAVSRGTASRVIVAGEVGVNRPDGLYPADKQDATSLQRSGRKINLYSSGGPLRTVHTTYIHGDVTLADNMCLCT